MAIENDTGTKLNVSELLNIASRLNGDLSRMNLKWTLLGETYVGIPRSYKEKLNVLFVTYKNGEVPAVFAIDKNTWATDFVCFFKEDE
ncbi:MAG TPA: hypothetical protein VLE44_03520 [Candidatus Saccharimonadales bacterium]|nr:hypothetical protein [Candidatus Saccharimonadales bacterium]